MRIKFWLLLSLACLVYASTVFLFVTAQLYFYVVAYTTVFIFGVSLLYRRVYRKMRTKYPEMPPDGKPDVYYGSGIPRPVYEDIEQHRGFQEKTQKAKKKTQTIT